MRLICLLIICRSATFNVLHYFDHGRIINHNFIGVLSISTYIYVYNYKYIFIFIIIIIYSLLGKQKYGRKNKYELIPKST